MAISVMADIVRVHGRERGEKAAVIYQGRTWTYGVCDEESSRVAQALLEEGVGPQDRIAFLDKNTPEYFTFLFGGAKVNAVCVAVNWRLAPREMGYILNDSEAKVLLIGEEFLGHLGQIEQNLRHVKKIVVIGSSDDHESYPQWVSRYPADDPRIQSAGADVCYQLYTSGTTGLPKGVELTNDNLFGLVPTASAEWRMDETMVTLVCMPLFHIAGSGWGVVGLYNGIPNVLTREVDPAEILRLIPEHGISIALFVPAVLQFLLMLPGVKETDFSSLRTVVYGASPITNEVLIRSMETFQCDFIQVYGLTETTGAITVLRPEDHDPGGPRAELLRSAGVPWGDVEFRIVDPDSREDLPDGQIGEIWIRSKQVMKGYWRQPEATREAILAGGWFRSGDAGYLKDGHLFIHDRVKDMIISGAENIYPAEIENVLMAHPQVADVAVIGVPDEKWGETVKALVVRAAGVDVLDRALIDYCRERLAHFKCPTSVDWVEAIPRNPSGKILKTELREPYWKGQERRVH
jgi:long-chain acyl-CoA synthetase